MMPITWQYASVANCYFIRHRPIPVTPIDNKRNESRTNAWDTNGIDPRQ